MSKFSAGGQPIAEHLTFSQPLGRNPVSILVFIPSLLEVILPIARALKVAIQYQSWFSFRAGS